MELVREVFYDKTPIFESIENEDGTFTQTENIINGATIIGTSTKYVLTENEIQIEELKKQLEATDYQAIKFAEGMLTEEEFAPIRIQRQEWRNQINALQEEV